MVSKDQMYETRLRSNLILNCSLSHFAFYNGKSGFYPSLLVGSSLGVIFQLMNGVVICASEISMYKVHSSIDTFNISTGAKPIITSKILR